MSTVGKHERLNLNKKNVDYILRVFNGTLVSLEGINYNAITTPKNGAVNGTL